MTYAGVLHPKERAELIAYVSSAKRDKQRG
jgi:hypothetical protein